MITLTNVTSDTIDAALAAAPASGCVIQLPPGRFMLTRSIRIASYCLTLRGECSSHPYFGRAATELVFPANADGILFDGRPNGKGERCSIEGLCLTSLAKATGAACGIISRGARSRIVNCGAYGFGGHGCRIEGDVSTGITSDLFSVADSTFASCGGHGLYIVGNVANAGRIVGASYEANGGWGMLEDGTLGNYHAACHASGNALGPYCVRAAKSRSTLAGCYSEGGQPPSLVGVNTVVTGGLHGAGIKLAPSS